MTQAPRRHRRSDPTRRRTGRPARSPGTGWTAPARDAPAAAPGCRIAALARPGRLPLPAPRGCDAGHAPQLGSTPPDAPTRGRRSGRGRPTEPDPTRHGPAPAGTGHPAPPSPPAPAAPPPRPAVARRSTTVAPVLPECRGRRGRRPSRRLHSRRPRHPGTGRRTRDRPTTLPGDPRDSCKSSYEHDTKHFRHSK